MTNIRFMKLFIVVLAVFNIAATVAAQHTSNNTDAKLPRLWTEQDRSELVQTLTANRDSIINFLQKLTPQQLVFHENERRWSIAEVFEHLERYEFAYFKEVTTIANMPLPDQKYLLSKAEDQFYKDYETDTVRAVTGKTMEPIGRFASIEKAIESFMITRNAFIQFITTTSSDLRRYFTFRNFTDQKQLSNPSKWNLRDLHQLVLTDISHAYRHMHQMEKVTVHPKFPK